MSALSETKEHLREGIVKTRQELVSLEEKALKKHLYIDFEKLRELMSAVDMADNSLTDGNFELSYESIESVDSKLRSFISSLLETENTIRASLNQLLERLKERYKEVSIDLPLDQIEILRRIISEITNCRDLEIYDLQKIGVLETAFEKALGGSVAEAESILRQDHKTIHLEEISSEIKLIIEPSLSKQYTNFVELINSGKTNEAINFLFERIRAEDAENLVYEILWNGVPLLRNNGIDSATIEKLVNEIKQHYSYSIPLCQYS